MSNDWYDNMIVEYERDGAADAEKGVFNLPYPFQEPENENENWAYEKGFKERRQQLGDKFSWGKSQSDKS